MKKVNNQKKNGAGQGSDSLSVPESHGDEKDESDAFWGLVHLFIKCHEGENKDYKELGASGDLNSKTSKANSKQNATGGSKQIKGSIKHAASIVSNDEMIKGGRNGAKGSAAVSNTGRSTKEGKKKAAD